MAELCKLSERTGGTSGIVLLVINYDVINIQKRLLVDRAMMLLRHNGLVLFFRARSLLLRFLRSERRGHRFVSYLLLLVYLSLLLNAGELLLGVTYW